MQEAEEDVITTLHITLLTEVQGLVVQGKQVLEQSLFQLLAQIILDLVAVGAETLARAITVLAKEAELE